MLSCITSSSNFTQCKQIISQLPIAHKNVFDYLTGKSSCYSFPSHKWNHFACFSIFKRSYFPLGQKWNRSSYSRHPVLYNVHERSSKHKFWCRCERTLQPAESYEEEGSIFAPLFGERAWWLNFPFFLDGKQLSNCGEVICDFQSHIGTLSDLAWHYK